MLRFRDSGSLMTLPFPTPPECSAGSSASGQLVNEERKWEDLLKSFKDQT